MESKIGKVRNIQGRKKCTKGKDREIWTERNGQNEMESGNGCTHGNRQREIERN